MSCQNLLDQLKEHGFLSLLLFSRRTIQLEKQKRRHIKDQNGTWRFLNENTQKFSS